MLYSLIFVFLICLAFLVGVRFERKKHNITESKKEVERKKARERVDRYNLLLDNIANYNGSNLKKGG